MKLLKNLVLFSMILTLTGCGSSNSAKKLLNSGRDKNSSGAELTAEEFRNFYNDYVTKSNEQKVLTEWSATSSKASSDEYNYIQESESSGEGFTVVNLAKNEIYSKSSAKSNEKLQITINHDLADINKESKEENFINSENNYSYSYTNKEYKDGSYEENKTSKSCDITGDIIWNNISMSSTINYHLNAYNIFSNDAKLKFLKKNNNTYYIMRTLTLDDMRDISSGYGLFNHDTYIKLVTNSKGLIISAYFETIYDYTYNGSYSKSTQKYAFVYEYKAKSYKFNSSKGYICPKE